MWVLGMMYCIYGTLPTPGKTFWQIENQVTQWLEMQFLANTPE
jgi:hypothetical protein